MKVYTLNSKIAGFRIQNMTLQQVSFITLFDKCALWTHFLHVRKRTHMHWCKCDAKQMHERDSITGRERQGDREGEKPQWCTPETADRSFGSSCYCQQLKRSFSLHRNTHSVLLHELFHKFLHSYYTKTNPVPLRVNQQLTWKEQFWKKKSTIIPPLRLHAQKTVPALLRK